MSIDKITDPASTPAAVADYQAQNTHLDRLLGNAVPPFPVDGSNIKKGSLFNIGGDMFYTSSDTAITGTPSDYVKLTPGASVAVPTYAVNLLGVTWNDAYNGYFDGSGNLYVFDTAKAIYDAAIAAVKDVLGIFAVLGHFIDLNVKDDLDVGGAITAGGNITTSTGTVGGADGNFQDKIEYARKDLSVNDFIHGTTDSDTVHDALVPPLVLIGDEMLITGSIKVGATETIVSRAVLTSTGGSGVVTLYGMQAGVAGTQLVQNGNATAVEVSLAW